MNILVVQSSFLGDTILSTPVISGLQTLYPGAELSMLTTPQAADLVKHDPGLTEVITFDKRQSEKGVSGLFQKSGEIRKKGFDIAYSLHRSPRTAALLFLAGIPQRIGFADASFRFLYTRIVTRDRSSHAVISNLSLLFDDLPRENFSLELRLFAPSGDAVDAGAINLLPPAGSYVVMAPGSAWKTKQWHWQGYAEAARFFKNQGIPVVLLGGKEDMSVCGEISGQGNAVDLSGHLSLTDTLYVMKNCRMVLCNDSMALHMASAFKKPTVTVFCATSPDFGFGPWENPRAVVVQDNTLSCKPCRRHGSMKCPNGSENCMRLDTEVVIEACAGLMSL